MRRVIFLGLAAESRTFDEAEGRSRAAEIWTLNDWYTFLPHVLHPDKIFNVHTDITSHAADATRFAGDTIAQYNDSGADIITSRYFPELTRCRPFDLGQLIDIRRDPFFSSTITVMFAMAWLERFDEIELVGVALSRGGEFERQVPAVVGAIIESERRGIRVIAPHLEAWAKRGIVVTEWNNAGCDYVPYWVEQTGCPAPKIVINTAGIDLPYSTYAKVTA